MVRLAVTSLLAVSAQLITARAADFDEVWEAAGPAATSAGMSAVATDPEHPEVVWLGSANTVWVSADQGESFHLVLHLSRAAGLVRETGGQREEQEDITPEGEAPEASEPEDEAAPEDTSDETELEDMVAAEPDITEDDFSLIDSGEGVADEAGGEPGDGALGEDDDGGEVRFGVVRMRVYGDWLYVCTSRGLFTVARSARRIGTGREVRFGRRVAVNDAAVTPDGTVWIATDDGLVQLGRDGVGRTVRGLKEDLSVRALVVAEGRLVLATSRGLRLASPNAAGYDSFSIGSRGEAGLEDVAVEAGGRLLVAGSGQVARILARPEEVPVTEEVWNVPGATRLAQGRGGSIWAVGARGSWRLQGDGGGFERVTEGLFDRRLRDVAAGYGERARLWAVGRSGAWRLVSEAGVIYSASASRVADRALVGFPTGEKVIAWATSARGVSLSQIDSWALEERLAWLLPRVELRGVFVRRRNEDFQTIPILDRQVLQAVDVRPEGDEFRVMAYWDVMPALIAAIDGGRSVYERTRTRARRQLERVREVVLPIYQAWARKKVDLAIAEDLELREAVRALLTLQRLESDLHVYTGGRFPISESHRNHP